MKNIIKIEERGITLVSLVVTVVILMVLTGIIITTSSDNNGVFNIANNKKEETERMTIEEEIKIQLEEDPPENYTELIEFLKNYGEIQNEEIPDEATLITEKGDYSFLVKDIWNIDKKELGISIGDYVEYSYDGGTYIVDGNYSGTNENQTITIQNSETSIWRVVDVNKQNKQVKIIPTNTYNYKVTLNGANGFNNGVKILNDLCNNIFSNIDFNTNARNITIEDIEKISSNISQLKGTNFGTEKEYTSIMYPYIVKLENDNSIQNEFFNGFGTDNNIKLLQTYYTGNIVYKSSNYENLIPEGSYWMASRAINDSNNAEYYLRTLNITNEVNLSGVKLYDSKGIVESNNLSILPVVTIDINNLKIGYGTEEEPYRLEK